MPAFEKVNSKVVKARVFPGQQVVSRRGAMLAYVGAVSFYPANASTGGGGFGGGGGGGGGFGGGGGGGFGGGGGGGLARMAGRAMAGEHTALMVGDGQGEVYYGFRGLQVTTMRLDGTQPLTAESNRILAHDMTLNPSVVFLGQQGGVRGMVSGAVTGQGLFTTRLGGAGDVALLAHGGTVSLDVRPDRPIVVDPQAYVGHIGSVTLNVTMNVSWRDAVGRGSGEAIQLQATGHGTVLVQASEQKF
jgi:uncharacterized protein (AIM24 family)